jgi:hypothetical protein
MTKLTTVIETYKEHRIEVNTYTDDTSFEVYAWNDRGSIAASVHMRSLIFYLEARQKARLSNAVEEVKRKIDELSSTIEEHTLLIAQAIGKDVVTELHR